MAMSVIRNRARHSLATVSTMNLVPLQSTDPQMFRAAPNPMMRTAASLVRFVCSNGNNPGNKPAAKAAAASSTIFSKFWSWTTREIPTYTRFSAPWWADKLLIFTVFGIVGSTSVKLVRPALKKLGLNGNMKDGPWSYRISSIMIVSPIYSLLLLTVGTLFGRHMYFASVATRIWSRFVPWKWIEKLMCGPGREKKRLETLAKSSTKTESTAAKK